MCCALNCWVISGLTISLQARASGYCFLLVYDTSLLQLPIVSPQLVACVFICLCVRQIPTDSQGGTTDQDGQLASGEQQQRAADYVLLDESSSSDEDEVTAEQSHLHLMPSLAFPYEPCQVADFVACGL